MSVTTPIPEPCDAILEEFYFQPLDQGMPAEDTPLMRAYNEEIDLIDDYHLTERYGRDRTELMWPLICAFAEVIL